jgi:hypothetical protein
VDENEIDTTYPNQKAARLSLTVSEGSVEITVERVIRADSEEVLRDQIKAASRFMLESVPMEEVKKTSARINETDENLREPHPVVLALVNENRKIVKELGTLNTSIHNLCERLGADQ